MPRALIIGGTGLIGRATARRLIAAGWRVDVTGRDRANLPTDLETAGVGFAAADRNDGVSLARAVDEGADLLVDCIGYTAAQARLLLPLLAHVGSTVFISSKAVYVDDDGRHSNTPGGPRFDGPVTEDQPTMAPRSDLDYNSAAGYGANKIAAEVVLLDADHPVAVLRPSKVHGEGARPPREWVFVKRILDQRSCLLLAQRGASVDHPSAAANIASLIETVAAQPARRVLNAADPDAPTVLEMSRAIARYLGYRWREILLEPDAMPGLGQTPWDRASPVVLDMTAATDLGYKPVGTYGETVTAELDWLRCIAQPGADGAELPDEFEPDGFFDEFLDYAAEDRYLGSAPRLA